MAANRFETDVDLQGHAVLNPGLVDGRDVSADGATLDSHVANASIHFTVASFDDDYVRVDGTNPMAANLAMGSFAITGVGNVDGRDVSADGASLDAHIATVSGNPHVVSLQNAYNAGTQITTTSVKGPLTINEAVAGTNILRVENRSSQELLLAHSSDGIHLYATKLFSELASTNGISLDYGEGFSSTVTWTMPETTGTVAMKEEHVLYIPEAPTDLQTIEGRLLFKPTGVQTETIFRIEGNPTGVDKFIFEAHDGTSTQFAVDQDAAAFGGAPVGGTALTINVASGAVTGLSIVGDASQVADVVSVSTQGAAALTIKADGQVQARETAYITSTDAADTILTVQSASGFTGKHFAIIEDTLHRIAMDAGGVFRWGGTTTDGAAYPSHLGAYGELWIQGAHPAGYSMALIPTAGADCVIIGAGDDTTYATTITLSRDLFVTKKTLEIKGFTGQTDWTLRDDTTVRIAGHTTQTNPLLLIEENDGTDIASFGSSSITLSKPVSMTGTFTLPNGTDVDEFSTDGTLAGDSDDAVPTEKAIKAYVDALKLTTNSPLHLGTKTNTPPGSPAEGDEHIVGDTPTGAWSAFTENNRARYHNAAWVEVTSIAGDRFFGTAEENDLFYNGTDWYEIVSPWTLSYQATHATAADSGRLGRMSSSSTNPAGDFPSTDHEIWVLLGELSFETGASAGTYSVSQTLREYTASPDVEFKFNTLTESSTTTYKREMAAGTMLTPLAVALNVSSPARVQIGWYNESTSPGALNNSFQSSWAWGYFVKKLVA